MRPGRDVGRQAILDRCEHLLDEGVATANLGQLTEAVAQLHTAFEELRPVMANLERDRQQPAEVVERATMLAARIKLSLAFPEHELGQLAAAGQSLDEAEKFAARGQHVDITALIHAQRGVMLLRAGRATDSLTELDRACLLYTSPSPRDRS